MTDYAYDESRDALVTSWNTGLDGEAAWENATEIGSVIRPVLTSHGYQVVVADSFEQIVSAATMRLPDAITGPKAAAWL